MKVLFRSIVSIILVSNFIVLAALPCSAQRSVSPSGQPGSQRHSYMAVGDMPGVAASNRTSLSAEARRTEYSALLRRKSALKRYLPTVSPESADYKATVKSIGELEAKLQSLEREALAATSLSLLLAAPSGPTTESAATAARPASRKKSADSPALRRNVSPSLVLTATAAQAAPALPTPPDDDDPAAESQPQNYVEWINRQIDNKVSALINQGSHANQTETPSESSNSTSLVDQSSSSDLIGVGLNLAGLSSGATNDNKDATSVSVTTSAYALYAAIKGADPLDPVFYNKNNKWRRLSFILGYDDEKEEGDDAETPDRATIAGFKYLIINGRDATEKENEDDTGNIRNGLFAATVQFGELNAAIRNFIFRNERVRNEFVKTDFLDFIRGELASARARVNTLEQRLTASNNAEENARTRAQIAAFQADIQGYQAVLESPTAGLFDITQPISQWSQEEKDYYAAGFTTSGLQNNFQRILGLLSDDDREQLEKFITDQINPFVNLTKTLRKSLERIRSKPQLSFAALTKTRKKGDDEYTSELIYERGMPGTTRAFITLNGGFKYKNSRLIGGDTRGGTAAGQLQFQVTPENSLISKSPIFLYFSTEGNWMSGLKPSYKAQTKVKIPITDGIEIPISLTYSNRTELVNESDVRGQFGFTIDTAKLLRLFKFKLPSTTERAPVFAPIQ
ncbi:MAG: hypothetical protein QOG71_2303 [Pyrinomonadaceae bacterium]|nr:hypothetical protein [Pyrinomonadaceae bacterium]